MSFAKAIKAFDENGREQLSRKDGHFWNTNAGLLNLSEAIQKEFARLHADIQSLEQRLQRLEHAQRR